MTESNLLELEIKAADPAHYSVQSRAQSTAFAPTSDVQGGGIFWLSMASQAHDDAPAWNAVYPNWRDRYLLEFARSEGMIASAKYAMKTRIGTLNYQLNGPPRAKKFAKALLESPGLGSTLSAEVQKLSDDLDGSDNGAFLELWRPGNPLSDAGNRPVLGFGHLDSRQCWRSYDPEFPVWYTNPVTGQVRKIHRSRIVVSADNPQPVELGRGIGFCAVSRALRMARVFRNMQIFVDEKVGGRFTRAIGTVTGITPDQLRAALQQNEAEADNKGFVIYKNIPYIVNPNLDPGSEIKMAMQDLASIPDGFVFRDEADLYAYILAFCFGVDAREFWPTTQSGATKADAAVQNMKARGKGIGNRIETVEYMIRKALPDTVAFEYDYTDDEQDRQVAEIHQLESGILKTYFDMGAINVAEVRALAVAKGILDGTLLATLQQPLTSDDNSEDATDAPVEDPTEGGGTEDKAPMTEKSYSDYRRSLRSLTRGYWNGELAAFDFTDGMVSAIMRHFEQAWQEVEKQYGIATDERTTDSQQRLNLAINTEISYISGFADAIAANSKANGGALQPLFDRADLWAAGYDRTITLAQSVIGADLKLKWIRDPQKDSCADCIQYDGMVFYRSEWEAAGVRPKGEMLECSGIQCGCTWEVTTERKTRGKVPALIGHKHLHALTA